MVDPIDAVRMHRALPGLVSFALALAATPAFATNRDLYVSSDASDVVRRYAGATGAFQSTFLGSNAAVGELGVHFGSNNNRVLVGHFSGGVEEFDATTGGYIKTYNAAGGTQWAGLYGPNGNVLIGDWATNDVREYDSSTGALVGVLTPVQMPADMRIGPNGHLYICSYSGGFVLEVDASTGGFVSSWSQPATAQTNDIAFHPNGEILVTAMITNVIYRYDAAHNLLGSFTGTGMARPHGIDLSPWTGHVLVADGVTNQVHDFDSATYVELDASFLDPPPNEKIVDIAFHPNVPRIACVSEDLVNTTGVAVDGVQILVEGFYTSFLDRDDGGFPSFSSQLIGPNTLLQWSGQATPPGAVRHVGICLNADWVKTLGVFWTAGPVVGCAPQCNSLYGQRTNGSGFLMYSNRLASCSAGALYAGNLQIEHYGANPPDLADMVVGGARTPMQVDVVPGIVAIPDGGVAEVPSAPSPPTGAEFSLLVFDVAADPGLTNATGDFVLTRVRREIPDSPLTPLCVPGQDGIAPCPCSNPPAGGGLGCNNFGAGPAASGTIDATGIASLTFDSVVLHATGENFSSLTVFWTGSGTMAPPGVAHGAGIRCVAGALRRLYTGAASAGSISRPRGGYPPITLRSVTLGIPISAGETRYYFAIYRDPSAAGPCGSSSATVNLTNAGAITWEM